MRMNSATYAFSPGDLKSRLALPLLLTPFPRAEIRLYILTSIETSLESKYIITKDALSRGI